MRPDLAQIAALNAGMPLVTENRPQTAEEERKARLAAALRENLKRRKAQARARRHLADTSPAAGSGSDSEVES